MITEKKSEQLIYLKKLIKNSIFQPQDDFQAGFNLALESVLARIQLMTGDFVTLGDREEVLEYFNDKIKSSK